MATSITAECPGSVYCTIAESED